MSIKNFSEIRSFIDSLESTDKFDILKKINDSILDYFQLQKTDVYLVLEKLVPLLTKENNKRLMMDLDTILGDFNKKNEESPSLIEDLDFSDINKKNDVIEVQKTPIAKIETITNFDNIDLNFNANKQTPKLSESDSLSKLSFNIDDIDNIKDVPIPDLKFNLSENSTRDYQSIRNPLEPEVKVAPNQNNIESREAIRATLPPGFKSTVLTQNPNDYQSIINPLEPEVKVVPIQNNIESRENIRATLPPGFKSTALTQNPNDYQSIKNPLEPEVKVAPNQNNIESREAIRATLPPGFKTPTLNKPELTNQKPPAINSDINMRGTLPPGFKTPNLNGELKAPPPTTNFRNTMNLKNNPDLKQMISSFGESFNANNYESFQINEGIKYIIPLITDAGIKASQDINTPKELYAFLKLIDNVHTLEEINEKYFSQVNQNVIFSVSMFKNIGFPSEFVINFLDKIIDLENKGFISFIKKPESKLDKKIKIKFGDLLLYMKAIDQSQLDKVLEHQKAWKQHVNKPNEKRPLLGSIILSFELVNENQINQALNIQKWYNSLDK